MKIKKANCERIRKSREKSENEINERRKGKNRRNQFEFIKMKEPEKGQKQVKTNRNERRM